MSRCILRTLTRRLVANTPTACKCTSRVKMRSAVMNETSQWIRSLLLVCVLAWQTVYVNGAIVPPPWSDPSKNPCAAMPGGWQLLYWAPLEQCFRIFTIGYPCPDTMELTPAGSSTKSNGMAAVCRCPPNTALPVQPSNSTQCFQLFEQGPCEVGQYFAPVAESKSKGTIRQGVCKTPLTCFSGMVRWPQDSKCYTLHTRGPCPRGKLIVMGKNKLAECKCENDGELAQYYYKPHGTCHEHFTVGPCEDDGKLFLPGGKCSCNVRLPHYHKETDRCYEIGTTGPCPAGHLYTIADSAAKNAHATCQCKEGYVNWYDGQCYHTYTRGPCAIDEFLLNATACIKNPCRKGYLYYPEHNQCYRIGEQGPCDFNQVIVFDFTARPSIDGISHNGVCGCKGIITNLDQKCSPDDIVSNPCQSVPGMIEMNGQCYKLYTRGPCGPGFWLEPRKIIKRNDKRGAHCACRPNYTQYESDDGIVGCYAPNVGIARYLNGKNYKIGMIGNEFVSSLEPSTTHDEQPKVTMGAHGA